jgi:hypothetical protein
MAPSSNDIKIINAPPQPFKGAPLAYVPSEEEPALKPEDHFGFAFFTKKPVEHLTAQVDELRDKIAKLVTSLGKSIASNAELDEISVGLAVSIDGDIGIASAGAEASIELTFKVKH